MKKLVSIILALAMILALNIPALAANVTIGTDATRKYDGYQLMTLTTSLKNENDGCANGVHNKDCYNYAYTINGAAYLEVLVNAINKDGIDTEQEVIDYIEKNIENNSDEMNDLAKAIYDEIKAKSIPGTRITGNDATDLAQGYWLFADVTTIEDGAYDATSFIMVKTNGQDDITITPKFGLPTVKKEVKDVNDTTGVTSDWQDSADADINDKVDFKLTATLGDYFDSYEKYTLIFHDEMSDYLELDTASFIVTAKNGNDSLDITNKYSIKYDLADDCDFEIIFENINNINGITKNTVFEVEYKATLKTGATFKNTNEVTLEYSNNPYDENSTGTTSDDVVVYTYNLTIDKKADSKTGPALKGAGFTLFKMYGTEERQIGNELVGGDMTQFVWNGLDDGTYVLKETTTPDGYNTMAPLTFTITADNTIDEVVTLTSTKLDNTLMTTNNTTGAISDIVVNNAGTVLPETGAMGTMWLIFGGAMLATLAGVFMITRKKMSIYED